MNTLKFCDVTLIDGHRAWINFHEIECIEDCYIRYDEETDSFIEGLDRTFKKITKVIMKSGRIYYVEFTLDSFDDKFYISKHYNHFNLDLDKSALD
ncbi:hypothetical protein P9074_11560 [Gallibacterium anatis]|uniref:hypothetical protein n=1 Tax=Gallibacterium anatis TaxID=750 RepID=UPI00300449FC